MYYGTDLDHKDHLDYQTNHRTSEMAAAAAQFAGQMALRLVHDRLLRLDVSRYNGVLTKAVAQIYKRINQLLKVGPPNSPAAFSPPAVKTGICIFRKSLMFF